MATMMPIGGDDRRHQALRQRAVDRVVDAAALLPGQQPVQRLQPPVRFSTGARPLTSTVTITQTRGTRGSGRTG